MDLRFNLCLPMASWHDGFDIVAVWPLSGVTALVKEGVVNARSFRHDFALWSWRSPATERGRAPKAAAKVRTGKAKVVAKKPSKK